MGTFESIIVVIASLFLLTIHLVSQSEIKKNNDGRFTGKIIVIGDKTRGRMVQWWGITITALVGVFFGLNIGFVAMLLLTLIADRLVVYRICRPNDILGKFLTRHNW